MNSLRTTLALAIFGIVPVSAQDLLNNGNFEADPYDNGWVQLGASPFGGLAPGSTKAATFGSANRIGQNLIGPSANWQLDFYFALKNTTNRAFSLFVTTTPNSANDGNVATINLRYQTGQFNTFSGGSWGSDLGLGTVDYSTDANADGDFDDAGDVKNVYRMRVTGTGWGTGNSSYRIELSNANETTFSRTTGDLNRYQNGSGNTSQPQAFLFNSLFGSNPGFYVDDVSFENIALPDDPNLAVTSALPIFGTLPVGATGITSRTVTVQNSGAANNLTITAATFTGANAANFSTTAAFPIIIAPGTSADIPVDFNPGAAKGAFNAVLELTSNDTSNPLTPVNLPVQLYVAGDPLITDGTFEPLPFPTPWVTTGTVTATAGLRASSATAAWLSGPATGGVNSTAGLAVIGPADWTLEFDVLILTDTGRAFQLLVHNFGEPNRLDGAPFHLRYEAGAFATLAAGNSWSLRPALGQMLPSTDANADGDFDDAGDAKNVYRIRLSGSGWGTPAAACSIAVSEANTPAYTRFDQGLTTFATAGAQVSPPTSFLFSTANATNPGFVVDSVTMLAGAPEPVAIFVPVTSVTADGSSVMLKWASDFNSLYRIWASENLVDWSVLDENLSGPAYSDAILPGRARRFYRVERQ
jgi:hypothetical protein